MAQSHTNNYKQDGARVDDNEWHVIDIKFNRGSVSLKLDDFIEDYVSLSFLSFFVLNGCPIVSDLHRHRRSPHI